MATFSVEPNERITFGIAHEDEHLAVIEKPAGLVTLPGRGHADDSLLNGLFARYGTRLQNLGRGRDFGLLHRLDKETSGLVCVAFTVAAYDHVRAQFAGRSTSKFYYALCEKPPEPREGVIKLAIAESRLSEHADSAPDVAHRGKIRPKTAHVTRAGKPAVTAYRTITENHLAALIEARPVTGRLHQVRVHLDAIGCPILGDAFYGPRRTRQAVPRLGLHAHRLVLEHPATGEPLDARCGLPRDMRRLLRRFQLPTPAELASQVDADEDEDNDAGETTEGRVA